MFDRWSLRGCLGITVGVMSCGLVACGGGGGGGGGGPSPSVVANLTTIAVQAKVTDASVAPSVVMLSVSNAPSSGLYVRASSSTAGISTLSPGTFTATSGQVQIFFKNPYTLAPSTYTDTVQIQVCPDSNCVTQVRGSPVSVAVTYTIAAVTGSAAPTLSSTFAPLFAQALPNDTVTPGAPGGGLSITNPPAFPLNVVLTSTNNGLQSVTLTQPLLSLTDGSLAGPMQVTFKPPNQLAPGVYSDSIKITACLDSACVNPIAGSPLVIQSTYQIGNSVPGPNGYTVNTVALQANDLVWDPQHSVIYASIAASSATNSNSVVALNPVSGSITASVALGAEPGPLAISDDGTELYVGMTTTGAIERISLPSLTPDLNIPLGSDPVLGQLYPYDLAAAPAIPGTVAVALVDGSSATFNVTHNAAGVAVFDGAMMRPIVGDAFTTAPGSNNQISYIVWGDSASSLYGVGSSGLQSFAVSVSGPVGGATFTPAGGKMSYLGGSIYTDLGQVVNGTTLNIVANAPAYTGAGPHRTIPDAALSRIFALYDNGATQNYIKIYDLQTYALIKTFTVLGPTLATYSSPALIAWGTNGLAYTGTNGQIVIINGPYLQQ